MQTATVPLVSGVRIRVEVLGRYGRLVSVRALKGQPFTQWTMGGPCTSDTAMYHPTALEDVKDEADNG